MTNQLLYKGKAKSLFTTENKDELLCVFRNDTSAFDGLRIEQLDKKGMVNNYFNAFIMEELAKAGVPTHFIKRHSDDSSIVKKLTMIPVECVIRNIAAGSLCRRIGIEMGTELNPPTVEFFLKNDALHDPMINDSLMVTFKWATQAQIDQIKAYSLKVNEVLKKRFLEAGLLLVDFKLEYGEFNGQLFLGDEFSPDGCRIWDQQTKKVLDKDRFRKEMGGVVEAYEEVAYRLGVKIPQTA